MKIKLTPWLLLAIIILSIALLVVFGIVAGQLLKALSTAWLIAIVILIAASAILYDYLEKKKNVREKTGLLNLGDQLFTNYKDEFASFYSLYLTDQKKFITKNKKLLKDAKGLDLKNLKPIEALYLFADTKKLVYLVDWKGEDDAKETEQFIEELLKQEITWENTSNLRAGSIAGTQRDGKFIIHLFNAIDKDLQKINQGLLFFDLGWDAYAFTVFASKTAGEIIKCSKAFHGADKLRA